MTLSEIVERVERATVGSSDLDRAVWEVAEPRVFRRAYNVQCGFMGRGATREHTIAAIRAPAFTTSLDKALTLRPANHDAVVYFNADGSGVAGCTPAQEDGCDMANSHAATPVLALVLASLRARLAMEKSA